MFDAPEVISKKIKSAVTDSEGSVRFADGKEGINNLMGIYACCTGLSYAQIEADFAGKGYGDFKAAVAEAVIEELRPVRERYTQYSTDKAYLKEVAAQGAERASRIANRTLGKVMKKIGFVLP